MAKGYLQTDTLCRELVEAAKQGSFKPVYLLMGDEPYYVDMVCDAVIRYALDESERDFNELICYGADVDADTVVSNARRYPMFAERQLVVIKEAQMMSDLEELAVYCAHPLESTVLVIAMHGGKADKRKGLYKAVSKIGAVVESEALRDYEVADWVMSYYRSIGLDLHPAGASILAEHAGTDLNKIVIETQKMLKNIPEGQVHISAEDVEKNVGISRQYSIFELTKELSAKNAPKALKIAARIGTAAKFAMPLATGALFTHFNRILKYEALLMSDPNPAQATKIKVLGVNPYFIREYDQAVRNYPLKKCMAVIALIRDYDYKGKGGEAGEAEPAELLVELVTRIINI